MAKRRNLIDRKYKVIRKVRYISKELPCPKCGTVSKRHSIGYRKLMEVGVTGPTAIEVMYSKHYCPKCNRRFNNPKMNYLAFKRASATKRVMKTAVNYLNNDHTLDQTLYYMRKKFFVELRASTLFDWRNNIEDWKKEENK